VDRYCSRDAVLISDIDDLQDDQDLLEDFILTMSAVLDHGRRVIMSCSYDLTWLKWFQRKRPQASTLFENRWSVPLPEESPSQDQIDWLIAFNARLQRLEFDIVKEGWRWNDDLSQCPEGFRNLLEDYQLEACVSYWLHPDDPDYGRIQRRTRNAGSCPSGRFDPGYRIDGNILTQRWYYRLHNEFGQLADGFDHNDRPLRAYRAIPNHCYLLHDLYDHAYGFHEQTLSLPSLTCIGGIEVRFLATMDWQIDLTQISGDPESGSPDDPSAEVWLVTFDERMRHLEEEITAEASRIEHILQRRLTDETDWTAGYEINAILTYDRREDDLTCGVESDEPTLAIRRCKLRHGRCEVFAESSNLSLENVLRIGTVRVQLNAETWTNLISPT
jgi:hypothetical protein